MADRINRNDFGATPSEPFVRVTGNDRGNSFASPSGGFTSGDDWMSQYDNLPPVPPASFDYDAYGSAPASATTPNRDSHRVQSGRPVSGAQPRRNQTEQKQPPKKNNPHNEERVRKQKTVFQSGEKPKKKKSSPKKKQNGGTFVTGQNINRVIDSRQKKKKSAKTAPFAREARNEKRNQKREKDWQRQVDRDNARVRSDDPHKNSDEKRRDFHREQKKRRNIVTIISIVALVFVLLGVVGGFVANSQLIVHSINIVNSSTATYTVEQIKSASGITEGDSMLTMNKNKMENRIVTNLPYIGSVKAEKQWPDVLVITIEETTDKFELVLGDNYVWLDENGKVLSKTKKKVGEGSMKVLGFDAEQEFKEGTQFNPSKANAEMYRVIQKIAEGSKVAEFNVRQVEFVKDSDLIKIKYDNYISIIAKYSNNFATKFAGVKDLMKEKNIHSAYYFDIRAKGAIRSNYGEFSE